ncbi:MAG: DUF6298 domain-containing protein [Pirellulaceae bacterium]|jgi:hypothetical protein|nr:DUF6298 domain-containing protein [Pirellulaceae bacterium]HJN12258.1 DUF6298 domain-containing protein [Pirellulaceae bacterium]
MSRLTTSIVINVWFLCWLVAGPVLIAADGRLEVSPTHPYYFRDGDRHVLLLGVSDRDVFTIWENDKGFSWRAYLDVLAAHRLNYVRQDVFSWRGIATWVRYPGQYSNPAWPFRRVGPDKAVDGLPRFDLTQFDQSYFDDRLSPFIRAARKRGIYVELTLFEGCRRASSFADSLYADENNVNHLGLEPRLATSDSALDHPRLLSIQHGFVDKVLAETADFGNVIYEVANETGGKRWVSHFVDYIHSHPTHPSSLVAAGEQTSAFDPRRGENDVVVKHRGGGGLYATDSDVRNHHDALLRFRVGKPVSHNEYFLFANRSTRDVNFPRKMMWADFTAGGHSNFFDFTFWRGTGRTTNDGQRSRPPPEEILKGGQYLLEFVSRNHVPFWAMEPHDELAEIRKIRDSGNEQKHQDVFTFARPGEEYVCYVLGDGPATVAVQLPDGVYTARWYDPKSGRFLSPTSTANGGDRRRLSSPDFEQDIVLHIRASG